MKFKLFADLKEFTELNARLVIALSIGMVGLGILQFLVHSSLSECIGIADSKETVVSFEYPVIVKKIYVLPGQSVRKGQPLLEVEAPQINLKLTEMQTRLQALESEQGVRNALLTSFSNEKKNGSGQDASPLGQEIAGLKRQIAQMKEQQSMAVRYAENDGVIATVTARPQEQVQQFLPVMTVTSNVPTLVYGFVNENLNFEVRIGQTVQVTPASDIARATTGRVVSVGSRITAFPERLQSFNPAGNVKMFYGRELIVALNPKNKVSIGEKVHITGFGPTHSSELGFQAFADAGGSEVVKSESIANGLPLEASALVVLDAKNILAAADEIGPVGSPFWIVGTDKSAAPVNLSMAGLNKINDVESLVADGKNFYAMGSLSPNKSGKVKTARNLLARFRLDSVGDTKAVTVDRSLDMRDLLIAAVAKLPMLQAMNDRLQDLEVESLAISGDDFIVGLKQPQLPDGSSVILRLVGLHAAVEAGLAVTEVNAQIQAMIRLENPNCENAERITDLTKTSDGILILANCKRAEKMGQLWYLADSDPSQQPRLIAPFRNGRPEGMALTADLTSIYVASDNGQNKGADLIRMPMPKLQ